MSVIEKERLVVIGNGMAGVRTLEELLKISPDLYDITVFGAEPYGNYNRIMLSPVLAGEKTIDDIMLNDDDWYDDNNVTLHKGKTVTRIDRRRKTVSSSDGLCVPYDRLILATGSKPVILPIPGADLPGVITFRDVHDVDLMIESAAHKAKAVVIGGGLLGLEAANGLVKRGMDVTVIHLVDTLMERQLDTQAGLLLQTSLEERGLKFLMGTATAAILGTTGVEGVSFKDGTSLEADIVVMAVGIQPNTSLAESVGVHCERGIVVNDTLQTYDPLIYAVGECVQHRNEVYGLVAPLFEQAKVCANHLAHKGFATYHGSMTSTKLKVTGIDLFSAGDFESGRGKEEIVLGDPGGGRYKKLVIKEDRLVGAVLYGDTVDSAWYFQLLRDQTDISEIRDQLMFGEARLGDSGHGGVNSAAAMSDHTEVCGCNGVCKGEIVASIEENKLTTLDEVRAHTKASSSCGSCTGIVEQLLAAAIGGDYSLTPKESPLCPCTDYTHDIVRNTILNQGLKTIPEVMRFLEWREPDGCPKCRPALNYYLLCASPDTYVDDARSRFVNERVHANIQKDGTYSVIPRIWGGDTSAADLRAIAEVAEKFNIPTVKITGGQRIALFGVRKEDLPAVWRDLNKAGMVSGHAYGKALRTVKTCVGSQWCRFGTQDSTSMGIDIERMTWGAGTPHKFKIAVSGCPRNCAEATIKDFGVVAVDSGWELHIGGNGGIKVRATDLLCKVSTDAEVKEYCGAFMQIYREEGHYLERTAPYIERVGLAYLKRRIVEDSVGRVELFKRFLFSQTFAQIDPWAEDETPAAEFQPLGLKEPVDA